MYFTLLPRDASLAFTSSVKATGEKTAREPFWRRTVGVVSYVGCIYQRNLGRGGMGEVTLFEGVHTDCSSTADFDLPEAPEGG